MTATKLPFGVARGVGYVAGRKVFSADMDGLLAHMAELRNRSGRHLIVTCNVDQAISLSESDGARSIYADATVVTLDGQPVRFLFRCLGVRTHRLTGADLLPAVSAAVVSGAKPWRVAIVGGRDGVAAAAASRLGGGRSEIVGFCLPHFEDAADERLQAVKRELRQFDPDIVFVCAGFPKQEKFVLDDDGQLPHAVYVGAGAAVDFAAGTVRRAPSAIQQFGLEWFWRVGQEPSRLWRRYFVRGPRFLVIAGRSIRHRRRIGDSILRRGASEAA